jgi:hypothetical protein
MAKRRRREEIEKQRQQDKPVLDHVGGIARAGRRSGRGSRHRGEGATTPVVHRGELEPGESVQEHIRREWTPDDGGLPTFY